MKIWQGFAAAAASVATAIATAQAISGLHIIQKSRKHDRIKFLVTMLRDIVTLTVRGRRLRPRAST